MNKCIDCNHWNKHIRRNTAPTIANCQKLSMTAPEEGVLVDMEGIFDKVGWEGGESYNTGKNFGCIHFESK